MIFWFSSSLWSFWQDWNGSTVLGRFPVSRPSEQAAIRSLVKALDIRLDCRGVFQHVSTCFNMFQHVSTCFNMFHDFKISSWVHLWTHLVHCDALWLLCLFLDIAWSRHPFRTSRSARPCSTRHYCITKPQPENACIILYQLSLQEDLERHEVSFATLVKA